MTSELTDSQAAFIQQEVDAKVAPGVSRMVLNFLGVGLCAWCRKEAVQGGARFCDDCDEAFNSLVYEWDGSE